LRTQVRAATIALIGALGLAAAGVQAAETVKVGVNGVLSDAPFFIADKKGYFAEQGLQAEFVRFDAGPQMVAPLGTGDLDAGAGASSAGLFNSAARGLGVKIVADKGSAGADYSYMPLIIRKDLVDQGKVKTFADLKGLKIGEAGRGGSPGSTLNEALKRGGLTYADVEHVQNLGYPEQVVALANHAIDGAITAEPSTTQAVEMGAAVRFSGGDLYPRQQIAVMLYGDNFIKKRHDAAVRFMVAYLKAVRFYNDAIKDARFDGKTAPEVIDILVANTNTKDRKLYAAMIPNGCNPDGSVNVESLKKDYAFYTAQGYSPAGVNLEALVDNSFVEAAVKVLGPYQAAR
jgi:NitT/TauT family transport system substrate-binding protein